MKNQRKCTGSNVLYCEQ